jgi:hypothetical protein
MSVSALVLMLPDANLPGIFHPCAHASNIHDFHGHFHSQAQAHSKATKANTSSTHRPSSTDPGKIQKVLEEARKVRESISTARATPTTSHANAQRTRVTAKPSAVSVPKSSSTQTTSTPPVALIEESNHQDRNSVVAQAHDAEPDLEALSEADMVLSRILTQAKRITDVNETTQGTNPVNSKTTKAGTRTLQTKNTPLTDRSAAPKSGPPRGVVVSSDSRTDKKPTTTQSRAAMQGASSKIDPRSSVVTSRSDAHQNKQTAKIPTSKKSGPVVVMHTAEEDPEKEHLATQGTEEHDMAAISHAAKASEHSTHTPMTSHQASSRADHTPNVARTSTQTTSRHHTHIALSQSGPFHNETGCRQHTHGTIRNDAIDSDSTREQSTAVRRSGAVDARVNIDMKNTISRSSTEPSSRQESTVLRQEAAALHPPSAVGTLSSHTDKKSTERDEKNDVSVQSAAAMLGEEDAWEVFVNAMEQV